MQSIDQNNQISRISQINQSNQTNQSINQPVHKQLKSKTIKSNPNQSVNQQSNSQSTNPSTILRPINQSVCPPVRVPILPQCVLRLCSTSLFAYLPLHSLSRLPPGRDVRDPLATRPPLSFARARARSKGLTPSLKGRDEDTTGRVPLE